MKRLSQMSGLCILLAIPINWPLGFNVGPAYVFLSAFPQLLGSAFMLFGLGALTGYGFGFFMEERAFSTERFYVGAVGFGLLANVGAWLSP